MIMFFAIFLEKVIHSLSLLVFRLSKEVFLSAVFCSHYTDLEVQYVKKPIALFLSQGIQTRKVNGVLCQPKVSRTINEWKSGKFMNLTDRSWYLNSNSFAMSKVWFRCHTIDLRIEDITNLTSRVRS